jgi:hypothetical protein
MVELTRGLAATGEPCAHALAGAARLSLSAFEGSLAGPTGGGVSLAGERCARFTPRSPGKSGAASRVPNIRNDRNPPFVTVGPRR